MKKTETLLYEANLKIITLTDAINAMKRDDSISARKLDAEMELLRAAVVYRDGIEILIDQRTDTNEGTG